MRISLPVCLLSLLLICFCASTTKADPILLTSGGASISFSPGFRFVSITGSGQDLQFHAIDNFDCPFPTGCGPNNGGSISKNNLGGFVTYQGITYSNFTMAFSFNDDTLTGFINVFSEPHSPPGTPALFTLNFIGYGFATLVTDPTDSRRGVSSFQVAVPEPATVLLLSAGLAGLTAKVRRRRKVN